MLCVEYLFTSQKGGDVQDVRGAQLDYGIPPGIYLPPNIKGIHLLRREMECQSCDTLDCYLRATYCIVATLKMRIMAALSGCKTYQEEDDVMKLL